MLYMAGGGRISRVHGPFVSDEEVEKVVRHLKSQGQPEYLEAVTAEEPQDEDGNPIFDATAMGGAGEGGDLYQQAVQIVLRDRKASTSYIQRRLQIGYNRAASLMERMEQEGVVGQPNHAGKREILLEGSNDESY
jgi:S-DNA-T family DNA segregation ATPase FtsK/SpoIIIE